MTTASGGTSEYQIVLTARVEVDRRGAAVGADFARTVFELRLQTAAADRPMAHAGSIQQHGCAGLLIRGPGGLVDNAQHTGLALGVYRCEVLEQAR